MHAGDARLPACVVVPVPAGPAGAAGARRFHDDRIARRERRLRTRTGRDDRPGRIDPWDDTVERSWRSDPGELQELHVVDPDPLDLDEDLTGSWDGVRDLRPVQAHGAADALEDDGPHQVAKSG